MALTVKKFGGTSLATPDLIIHSAKRVAKDIRSGNPCVVVVSAMGRTTDELLSKAELITQSNQGRETDMLLTAGERMSMALFSMALNSMNIKAHSFTGSQVGIITTPDHTKARILKIRGERLLDAIKNGITPIVAGFQGVSETREVTTLGRGGSDTTAAALSAYLNAEKCEIFTDVEGVYAADPRIVPNARLISSISYDEMLLMSHSGSKVMHPRSVEIAKRFGFPIYVRSSFSEGDGTMISDNKRIEENEVTGICSKENLAMVNLKSPKANIVEILRNMSESGTGIDLFINKSPDAVSIIVEQEKLNGILTLSENFSESISINNDISVITVIGTGITDDPEIMKKILSALKKYEEDIFSFSTNKLSLSIVTKKPYVKKIIQEASKLFNLEHND